jgi:hypothetical protein
VTGVANHHQTAAIVLRDIRRSASGVRKEIGFILQGMFTSPWNPELVNVAIGAGSMRRNRVAKGERQFWVEIIDFSW